MTVKQIALVQHRRGLEIDLPDYMEEGEIGFSYDTGSIFIGAPNLTSVKTRIRSQSNIFPYANIQILTELSDNLNIIRHVYQSNTSMVANFPTIVTGSTPADPITLGDTITINNGTSSFSLDISIYGLTLDNVVSAINNALIPNVLAVNYNNYFRLIGNVGNDIYVQNDVGTPLQSLKILLPSESSKTFSSTGLISRTLQEVLDDHLSIKSYGVKGDGSTDDSATINAILTNIYTIGTEPEFLREIFVPAGVYYLENDTVYLPRGTYLRGEGHNRTIFRSYSATKPVLSTMDGYGRTSDSISFGSGAAPQPEKITVEKIGFEHTEDVDVVILTGAREVLFRDCRFKSGGNLVSKLLQIPAGGSYTTLEKIIFENCIFEDAYDGVILYGKIDYATFDDCIFQNIPNWAVHFDGMLGNAPERCLVSDSRFINCGTSSLQIIVIETNCKYCIAINNFFDDPYSEITGINPVTINSSTSYSNWVLEQYIEHTFLKSAIPSPIWQYVTALRDYNGELVVDAAEWGNVPGQDNHLVIVPGVGVTPLTINVSKTDGEWQLLTNGTGHLYLGGGGTGTVDLATDFDVAGHIITNDTGPLDSDIQFKTNGLGVITTISPSGPYEDKIVARDYRPDLVNKGYVDDEIARQTGIYLRRGSIVANGTDTFLIDLPLPAVVNPPVLGLAFARLYFHVITIFGGDDVTYAYVSNGALPLTDYLDVEPTYNTTYTVLGDSTVDIQSQQLQISFLRSDGLTPSEPVSGEALVYIEIYNR